MLISSTIKTCTLLQSFCKARSLEPAAMLLLVKLCTPSMAALCNVRALTWFVETFGLPPPADRHPTLHPHLDLESDDPEPDRERAPSPTPTVPGYVPSTHIPATESTHSTPNPLDPAIADHRNRPWPPADDRTLIRLFVGRWIPNLVLPGKPSQVE